MLHNPDKNDIFAAIREAAETKSYKEVIDLVKTTDLSIKNADNLTPIQLARSLSLWKLIEEIAKEKKTDTVDQAKYGDALISAAIKNEYKLAKVLLAAGAAKHWYISDNGNRCLHWAVKNKNIKMLKLFLKYDMDITITNKAKQTPIQLAALDDFWEGVILLTNKKVDEKDIAKYNDILTDILFAAIKAHKTSPNITVIASLIQAGASLATIKNGKTAIQLANSLKLWDCIESIAKTKKNDEKDTAKFGDPLLDAVIEKRFETTKIMLKAKASTTWSNTTDKNGCLHHAVINNQAEMVKLLLEYDASPDKQNLNKQTPLELACAMGSWGCAEILVQEKKFKFKDSNQAGFAFMNAVKAGQFKIANDLIKVGASTNTQATPNDATALHWAVEQNNLKCIEFLLKNKASQIILYKDETPIELACRLERWDCAQYLLEFDDITEKRNVVELHYENALINTIKAGNYAIAKILLEQHASCHKRNSEMGNIALYWSIKLNRPDLVELLLSFGADPTIRNMAGKTSYDLARDLQHENCFKKSMLENSTKLLAGDTATLLMNADTLYQALIENAIKAENISSTLKELKEIQLAILKNDLLDLKAYRATCAKEQGL